MQIRYSVITAPKHGRENEGQISEDAHACAPESMRPFFAAVADGHGGKNRATAELSQYIVNRMIDIFYSQPDAISTFEEMFDLIQAEVRASTLRHMNGAVATCIMIDDEQHNLVVAHAGDCRVYSFNQITRESELLTQDHRVDNPDEMKRLRPFYDSGEFAPWLHGDKEVLHLKAPDGKLSSGYVEPTRGFGDPPFQPAYTHTPEVKAFSFNPDVPSMFILCSDGGVAMVRRALLWAKTIGISSLDGVTEIMYNKLPEKPGDDIKIVIIEILPTL